ncbi:His/Gly/Thr/Pro-type tRNA ligase C-terminal domain-containing protein, partial [Chloroflexota bacterium]
IMATGGKSLKAQMRQANSLGVKHAVIIGEEEVKSGTVMLRYMADARQETVSRDEIPDRLR